MTENDRERQLPAHKQDKAEIVCCDKVIGEEGNDNNWEFQSLQIRNKIILKKEIVFFNDRNMVHDEQS